MHLQNWRVNGPLVGVSQETGVAVTFWKIASSSTVDDVITSPGCSAGGFRPDALRVGRDVTAFGRDATAIGDVETKKFGNSLLRRGKTSRALVPVLLNFDGPLPLKHKDTLCKKRIVVQNKLNLLEKIIF
jgi:hypothetical protein